MTRRAKVLRIGLVVGAIGVAALIAVSIVASRLGPARMASNETAAIAALRTYLGAQSQFHRTDHYGKGHRVYANPDDGSGYPDLYEIGGPGSGGKRLELIDREFAEARHGGPFEKPRSGYLFIDIEYDDFSTDCGLWAYPARHDRSGRNVFFIDMTGVVYHNDLRGQIPDPVPLGFGRPRERTVPEFPSDVPTEDIKAVVTANNALAFDLYARFKDTDRKNLFFSPYSVLTGFAMCLAGARGNTSDEMARALHIELAPKNLHRAMQALTAYIAAGAGDTGCRLHVANALWLQEGYGFREQFVHLLKNSYAAEVQAVDFRARLAACDSINRWIAQRTKGEIPSVIAPQELDPLTKLALTNAIYFKGEWGSKFDVSRTQTRAFTLTGGEEVMVPTMTKDTEDHRYVSDSDIELLVLPYKSTTLEMVVLLPRTPSGIVDLENTLSVERLEKLLSWTRNREVRVYLPRFAVTSGFDLMPALRKMGMMDAFSGTADFTGISDRRPLFILTAKHNALVRVDEEGTVAAAATFIAIGSNGDKPVVFRADHPFIFLIMDTETGAILFMGRVMDPR